MAQPIGARANIGARSKKRPVANEVANEEPPSALPRSAQPPSKQARPADRQLPPAALDGHTIVDARRVSPIELALARTSAGHLSQSQQNPTLGARESQTGAKKPPLPPPIGARKGTATGKASAVRSSDMKVDRTERNLPRTQEDQELTPAPPPYPPFQPPSAKGPPVRRVPSLAAPPPVSLPIGAPIGARSSMQSTHQVTDDAATEGGFEDNAEPENTQDEEIIDERHGAARTNSSQNQEIDHTDTHESVSADQQDRDLQSGGAQEETDEIDPQLGDSVMLDADALPVADADICWDFAAGRCWRGARCWFQHIEGVGAKAAAARALADAGWSWPIGTLSEPAHRLQELFVAAGLVSREESGAASTAAALAKAAPSGDGFKNWSKRCPMTILSRRQPPTEKIEYVKIVVLRRAAMDNLDFGDAELLKWTLWMDWRLTTALQEKGATKVEIEDLDFSDNRLSANGIQALCALLEKHAVRCASLKLNRNKLCDTALREISRYLTAFHAAPVRELHLNDNPISLKGLSWLFSCVVMHPAYPITAPECFLPLRLFAGNRDTSVGDIRKVAKNCGLNMHFGTGSTQPMIIFNSKKLKHDCAVELVTPHTVIATKPQLAPYARAFFCKADQMIYPITGMRTTPYVLSETEDIIVIYKPPGWICDANGIDAHVMKLPKQGRALRQAQLLVQDDCPSIVEWCILHASKNAKCVAALEATPHYGLVHRLDLNTSGPILLAKSAQGYDHLIELIRDRHIVKDYIALVHGAFTEEAGAVDARIDKRRYPPRVHIDDAGDTAVTLWEVVATYEAAEKSSEKYTLVHLRIITGRTHQIRVHLSHIGHPLVSDWQYNPNQQQAEKDQMLCHRIFLHKFRVSYVDLQGYATTVSCSLEYAPELSQALQQLRLVSGMGKLGCAAPCCQT